MSTTFAVQGVLLFYGSIKRFYSLLEIYLSFQLHTKILSHILSRLTPYAVEIIEGHQCGFRRNRSNTDRIFCSRQIQEKRWEYNGTVYWLFIDSKKVFASVRREVLKYCTVFLLSLECPEN
jgi:hypothetical protein